jgi:hypothetical protein
VKSEAAMGNVHAGGAPDAGEGEATLILEQATHSKLARFLQDHGVRELSTVAGDACVGTKLCSRCGVDFELHLFLPRSRAPLSG